MNPDRPVVIELSFAKSVPPVGQARVLPSASSLQIAVKDDLSIQFVGWLGLLRVLTDLVVEPSPPCPRKG
jgi:hypothetical protein